MKAIYKKAYRSVDIFYEEYNDRTDEYENMYVTTFYNVDLKELGDDSYKIVCNGATIGYGDKSDLTIDERGVE